MSSSTINTVTIELTGPLERAVGQERLQIDWPHAAPLGQLLLRISDDFPSAADLLGDRSRLEPADGDCPPGVLVIRDGEAIPPRLETVIEPGQRLTLMPMISGG